MPDDSPEAVTIHGEFLADLLRGQDDTKSSLDARALSVITSSGTVVGLMFGLVAAISGAKNFELPSAADGPLTMAVVFFVMASVVSLGVIAPIWRYKTPIPGSLKKLRDNWDESEKTARRRVYATRVVQYETALRTNQLKALVLAIAVFFEIMGIGTVARAVVVIVRS